MRVVYWARLQLARQQVLDALQAVPGAELSVVETLAELLGALNGAEALILYDAPPDQAVKQPSQTGSGFRTRERRCPTNNPN